MCNKPFRPQYGWGKIKFWLERPCYVRVYLPKRQTMLFFGMCMKDALWTMDNVSIAETLLYSKLQAFEKNK